MYESNYSTEKQNIINEETKLTKNKFTKSLTSFHTKKSISKNISNQNPQKKQISIKQDKSVKKKRIYLSSKKANAFNYLNINPTSPQNNLIYDLNNQENENIEKKILFNAPSSVQRDYKYQNCYILNNLNNYQSNVIPGSKIKSDDKLSESIENNLNNNNINNISDSCSENRKTNGASSNLNEIIETNSLIQPPINGLNTITFNINNNYNNCYNNYDLNNNKGFDNFNGCMSVNGFEGMTSKSISNLNDFKTLNSMDKLLNKIENNENDDFKNININIPTDSKTINNKRSALFKDKSKNKIKNNQGINTNSTISNFNNTKKNNQNILANFNNNNENNNNKKYVYNTVNNDIKNEENIIITQKNICYFFDKNNTISNQRNYNNNVMEKTKTLNIEPYEKIQNEKIEPNLNSKLKDSNKKMNIQYQTFSSSFRNKSNKKIKVNMIENRKIPNDKINNNNDENLYNNIQKTNQPNIGFKNTNKSTDNLKSLVYKNESKSIYGTKKYNKKNNSQLNKKINIINNNKSKFNDKNKNSKNILIQTYNNFKLDKEDVENIGQKEDINKTNYNETPRFNNNELQTKSVNCLNCYIKKGNIIPLSRENSITYIRKKSLNMKIYNNEYNNLMSSRPLTYKHKKNYSISSSCYNSQRYLNVPKNEQKNKTNKKSNIYISKNNTNDINEKTIIIPEYKLKLENIKSRINNLLNIYSLLALRSLNSPVIEHNHNRINMENSEKNEGY